MKHNSVLPQAKRYIIEKPHETNLILEKLKRNTY